MATPMILELKRRIPGARIYILTWPSYGTDQIFEAPVVQAGGRMEDGGFKGEDLGNRRQDSGDGGRGRRVESVGTRVEGSEVSRADSSPVAGIFLLDPAAATWRKALFFVGLRRWKFNVGFIPFDACPPFIWWGFSVAGINIIAGHYFEP